MLMTTGKEKPLETRVQEVPLAIQHVHLQKSGVRSIPIERTVIKRTSELLGSWWSAEVCGTAASSTIVGWAVLRHLCSTAESMQMTFCILR